MFTGIITDIGTVKTVATKGKGKRLAIATRLPLGKVAKGASIAVSGACLTVTEKGKDWFAADVSPETLQCTAIGTWKKGTKVNLEQALKFGDELGGHLVSGHVDGVAKVKKITKLGSNTKLTITAPKKLAQFIAAKGSVTLDGVSLTVNKVKGNQFTVNIIPHTWKETTFYTLKTGSTLHLEIDLLARYTARLLKKKGKK